MRPLSSLLSPLPVLAVVSILLTVSVSAYFVLNDDKHDISIAWANKDCYEPFWIADALGYWEDEGVKVNGIIMNNGSECAAAVLSGNADLGGMGADPLLRMLRDDRGASVLARYQTGHSHSEFVARDGKISMSTYAALLEESEASEDDTYLIEYLNEAVKGARVGMQVGTAYWSWFLGFLETIGLTADDVTIVPLDFNVQVAALDKGEVDMISGGSPNTENALSLISDSFMIRDPDQKLASIFLMASGSAQAAKSDAIVKVLNGLQRACDFIYSNPEEAAQIIIDAYGRNWSIQQQSDVFKKSIWGIDIVDADIEALVTAASLINNAGQERMGPLPDTEEMIKERVFRTFMLAAGLPTDDLILRETEAGIDPHYTEL